MSNLLTNKAPYAANTDITTLFEPYRSGATQQTTGIISNGTDIGYGYITTATPYLPSATSVVNPTGYTHPTTGTDISTLLQPLGYAPGTTARLGRSGGSSGTIYPSSFGVGYNVYAFIFVIVGGGGAGVDSSTFCSGPGGGGGGALSGTVNGFSSIDFYAGPGGINPGGSIAYSGGTSYLLYGSISAFGGLGANQNGTVGYGGGYGFSPPSYISIYDAKFGGNGGNYGCWGGDGTAGGNCSRIRMPPTFQGYATIGAGAGVGGAYENTRPGGGASPWGNGGGGYIPGYGGGGTGGAGGWTGQNGGSGVIFFFY